MWITFLWSNLQSLWPLSACRSDDVTASKRIVSNLPIPEDTKRFVFAFRDPQTQSLIYILSALNLSERSASDARCLITAVKPDAVLVHAASSHDLADIQSEEQYNPLPTSSFGVIKRCLVEGIGLDRYEYVARCFVLREIFGTGFHGHVLAAKMAAEEVGSSFLMIDSPIENFFWGGSSSNSSSSNTSASRLCLNNEVFSSSSVENEINKPISGYETPAFAKSIYPLLEYLHGVFGDLPSIGKALAHAQKMLLDVSRGEVLDTRVVSEVYTFRIAVEWLRIALSENGLRPIKRNGGVGGEVEFSELPFEDKSHVLFVQAIRGKSDKYRTIVAVVDAGSLGGLRKHWDTPVPSPVKDMMLREEAPHGVVLNGGGDRKWLLAERPVVAVGAGATAILGASSLSKVVPASTLMKVVTCKVPASVKLILSQTEKALAFASGPSSKVVAASGAKASSAMKASAYAENIRAVTQSVIAFAERTSISAVKTAFCEIMRKRRRVQRVGVLPWATFACSMGACAGLIVYGDGIECAVESVPAAPSIASLGRGIQHLREASQAVMMMQAEGTSQNPKISSLINRIKKSRYG